MYLPAKYNKFHKLEIPIKDGNSSKSKPHVDPTVINNALIRGACASRDNPDVSLGNCRVSRLGSRGRGFEVEVEVKKSRSSLKSRGRGFEVEVKKSRSRLKSRGRG